MRYSTEPSAKKSEDKYGEKIMYNATKTVIDTAKTVSKRFVQKHKKLYEI